MVQEYHNPSNIIPTTVVCSNEEVSGEIDVVVDDFFLNAGSHRVIQETIDRRALAVGADSFADYEVRFLVLLEWEVATPRRP